MRKDDALAAQIGRQPEQQMRLDPGPRVADILAKATDHAKLGERLDHRAAADRNLQLYPGYEGQRLLID